VKAPCRSKCSGSAAVEAVVRITSPNSGPTVNAVPAKCRSRSNDFLARIGVSAVTMVKKPSRAYWRRQVVDLPFNPKKCGNAKLLPNVAAGVSRTRCRFSLRHDRIV